jgi:hypothetical protein
MHIYVHHLLFKLERNGAYPDGPGQDVTCSGKSLVLYARNGVQQLSPQLQSGHPVHLARCNFYKLLLHQHLKLLLFVTQTNVFLWTWQWNYKMYIPHCRLYSCTVYLSQCVNQDCQHTAAESRSNLLKLHCKTVNTDLPPLGFEGQFCFQLLCFGSPQCLNGCAEIIIVGIPFSHTEFHPKDVLDTQGTFFISIFTFFLYQQMFAKHCRHLFHMC